MKVNRLSFPCLVILIVVAALVLPRVQSVRTPSRTQTRIVAPPKLPFPTTTSQQSSPISSSEPIFEPFAEGEGGIMSQEVVPPAFGKVGSSIALVSGTTVGAGILALASVSQKPGFVASSVALIGAWVFMTLTGLLIAEVSCNVAQKNPNKSENFGILAMTSQLLGKPGAVASGAIYIFIHYALLVAYIAEAGRGISEAAHLSDTLGPLLFTSVIGGITAFASTSIVETMNNAFFIVVIVSFVALAGLGVGYVHPSNLEYADFNVVAPVIPIMLVALVYHNVVPSVTSELNYHKPSIRTAVTAGSFIPLVMFLAWNAVILGQIGDYQAVLDSNTPIDAIQLLQSNLPDDAKAYSTTITAIFSQSAIVTSFIGFFIGLMEFYGDVFPQRPKKDPFLVALVLVPPTVIALADPTIFLNALDVAGTYGISVLFGALPAVLAWKLRGNWDVFTVTSSSSEVDAVTTTTTTNPLQRTILSEGSLLEASSSGIGTPGMTSTDSVSRSSSMSTINISSSTSSSSRSSSSGGGSSSGKISMLQGLMNSWTQFTTASSSSTTTAATAALPLVSLEEASGAIKDETDVDVDEEDNNSYDDDALLPAAKALERQKIRTNSKKNRLSSVLGGRRSQEQRGSAVEMGTVTDRGIKNEPIGADSREVRMGGNGYSYRPVRDETNIGTLRGSCDSDSSELEDSEQQQGQLQGTSVTTPNYRRNNSGVTAGPAGVQDVLYDRFVPGGNLVLYGIVGTTLVIIAEKIAYSL